jgi:hypothetical protein
MKICVHELISAIETKSATPPPHRPDDPDAAKEWILRPVQASNQPNEVSTVLFIARARRCSDPCAQSPSPPARQPLHQAHEKETTTTLHRLPK